MVVQVNESWAYNESATVDLVANSANVKMANGNDPIGDNGHIALYARRAVAHVKRPASQKNIRVNRRLELLGKPARIANNCCQQDGDESPNRYLFFHW